MSTPNSIQQVLVYNGQAVAEKRAAALQSEREARRAAEGKAAGADATRLADGRLRRAAERKVTTMPPPPPPRFHFASSGTLIADIGAGVRG